ncbi:MAG: tRNA-(ms[2]io[6]A)-hydroxylase, partial [Planctomycetota bacterium]
TYLKLAREFAADDEVRQRLDALAAAEAEIIAIGEPQARMHS